MPLAGDIVVSTDFSTALAAANGPWTGYTPSLLNVTVGNGTLTAEFLQVGKRVDFKIALTFGSTTTLGTLPNSPRFGLPVTAADSNWVAVCFLYDNSTTANRQPGVAAVNGSQMVPYGKTGDVDSANPFAWAVSDVLRITGTYEAA